MNIATLKRRCTALLSLASLVWLAGCAPIGNSQAQSSSPSEKSAPVHVVINMPAGKTPPADLPAKAAGWRKDGTVSRALWVDSVTEEKPTPGFAALMTLEFPDKGAHARWAQAESATLAPVASVALAEVLVQEKVAAYDPNITEFKVSYYLPVAPRSEITTWVDGYLKKYLHAQLQTGILVSYVMYLVADSGEQGRLLLVLQYHDARIAREAEPIKGRLSDELAAKDSRYAELATWKEKLRTTQSVTLAKYQPLPSP